VEKERPLGHLDLEATGDLLARLGKNIEAAQEQSLVGFDPRKILVE
jgi:hypothetical protein